MSQTYRWIYRFVGLPVSSAVTVWNSAGGVAATGTTDEFGTLEVNLTTGRYFANNAAGTKAVEPVAQYEPSANDATGVIFTPETYGAVGDGVVNDTAAIAATYAAAAAAGGGILQFGAKKYLTSEIAHSSANVLLTGVAPTSGTISGAYSATIIKTISGHHGITITGQGAGVKNLCVKSNENGTGSSDGIRIQTTKVRLDGVSVEKFGRRGIGIYGASSNCNLFRIGDCSIYANGGDGIYIEGGSDSNAGSIFGCDIYNNGGYGVSNTGATNTIQNSHFLTNTTGAIYDNGLSSKYEQIYIEAPQAFICGPDSREGVYDKPIFGGVSPSGDAGALSTWRITSNQGALTHWKVQGRATLPSAYNMTVDVAGDTYFTLDYDGSQTGGTYASKNILTYNRWQDRLYINAPTTFSSFITTAAYATGARPAAGDVPAGAQVYDTTLGIPIWSNGTVWRNAAGTTV